MSRPAGSTKKLVILGAAAVFILLTLAAASLTINTVQANYYRANESRLLEEWCREQQPQASIENSLQVIRERTFALAGIFLLYLLYGVFGLVCIRFADTTPAKDGMDTSWLLELAFALHLGLVTFDAGGMPLEGAAAWCVLIGGIVLILACLAYAAACRGILGHGEVLIYAPVLANIVGLFSFYFFSGDVRSEPDICRLEEYSGVRPAVKDRIIGLCLENGIGSKHLFVRSMCCVNACAVSNIRTKSLIINSESLRLLPEDLLQAQILHEVGHIARGHMGFLCLFMLFQQLALLAMSVLTYRTVKRHYSGLAAVYLTFFTTLILDNVLAGAENILVRWPMEYSADLYALELGHAGATRRLMRLYGALSKGSCFDFMTLFGVFIAHPPLYRRIRQCKEYLPRDESN